MRRFPLHAYATCAALLIGCESPVAVSPPAPPPNSEPSLSVEISGPSQIDANGLFSWAAFAFGGSGAYRYDWIVANKSGKSIMTTTQQKVSLRVSDTDGDLLLTLTVASGSQQSVETFRVTNCIGGCPR